MCKDANSPKAGESSNWNCISTMNDPSLSKSSLRVLMLSTESAAQSKKIFSSMPKHCEAISIKYRSLMPIDKFRPALSSFADF